jgi:hypothetical protein
MLTDLTTTFRCARQEIATFYAAISHSCRDFPALDVHVRQPNRPGRRDGELDAAIVGLGLALRSVLRSGAGCDEIAIVEATG